MRVDVIEIDIYWHWFCMIYFRIDKTEVKVLVTENFPYLRNPGQSVFTKANIDILIFSYFSILAQSLKKDTISKIWFQKDLFPNYYT